MEPEQHEPTIITGQVTIPRGSIEYTVADKKIRDKSNVLANISGIRDATFTRLEDVRVADEIVTFRGNATATGDIVVNYIVFV